MAGEGIHPVLRGLAWPMLAFIRFYRRFISPLTPPSCRFYPSCSAYGLTAIEMYGPFKGGWMAARRILSCHPFHPGGTDPVPGSALQKKLEAHAGQEAASSEAHVGCEHP